MSNNRHRVDIPTNPSEIIALLEAIKTKHEALGPDTPLAGLKWTEIGAAFTVAKEQNQLSIDLRRKAEAATGARDVKIPALTEAVRSARDILMGLNRDNPDALGEFGFDVADARSSAAPPVPPPA